MRFVLLACFITVTLQASETPYYRFWRGVKRQVQVKDSGKKDGEGFKIFVDDPSWPMTENDFKNLINAWLIPATTSCCAQSSLVAYLPALLPNGEKPNGLHDEVALIVYSSEEAYKRTRADKTNEEAYTYGPLHGDVFDMAKSSSLIPTAFSGNLDLSKDIAFDVLSGPVDWQNGFTTFRVALINETATIQNHLTQVKTKAKQWDLTGYVILLTKQYAIEYHHWVDRAAWKAHYHKAFLPNAKPYLELIAKDLTQVEGNELRYSPLNFKEVGSVRFIPGKKPVPSQTHHRLEK